MYIWRWVSTWESSLCNCLYFWLSGIASIDLETAGAEKGWGSTRGKKTGQKERRHPSRIQRAAERRSQRKEEQQLQTLGGRRREPGPKSLE